MLLLDPSYNCAEVSRETFVINMMLLSPGGGTVKRYLLITNGLPTMTKQNKQRGQTHKNRTACILIFHDYIPTRVTIAFSV